MRRQKGNLILTLSALTCFGLSTVIPNSTADSAKPPAKVARANQEPKEFDRLDGHGPTGKKVDVIEWENNLEIHVYPKGSLRTLGLKIDREPKTTKNAVMVIEYAFNGVPYTLIRRAILSIPMNDNFKAFQETAADGYDKIIISNNTLADGVRPYTLAPAPTQLYPDYHPALESGDGSDSKMANQPATGEPAKTYQRKSASEGGPTSEPKGPGIQLRKASEFDQDGQGTSRKRSQENDGTGGEERIRNFAF